MLEILITSSILIAALVLLRYLLRNKISRRLQYALWLLAALRLLVPVTVFPNPLNVMNFLQSAAEAGETPEQSASGNRIVYRAEALLEGKETGREGDSQEAYKTQGSTNEQMSPQVQGILEKQRGTDISGAYGKEEMLSLKEMEYLLEGGSLLNRFFLKGYGRYTWYLGMAVLGAWMVGCNLIFRRKISGNRTYLGKEGGLKVYSTDEITSPCLLGILSPAIYLTGETARNPRHREYALLHELIHYRHKDHIWAFVRSLCLVLYWFDPLVWLAVYLSARDCEMACDEGVVYGLGKERSREYGCTLIEMAASCKRGVSLLRCATGFFFRKRELKVRISHIAAGRRKMGVFAAALVMTCMAVLAACTFGGAKKDAGMGRYVETVVELPRRSTQYWGLSQDGTEIRLIAAGGLDVVSKGSGAEFVEVTAADMPEGTLALTRRSLMYAAGAMDGSRAFIGMTGSGQKRRLKSTVITEAGERIGLEVLDGHYVKFFYSQGWYYVYDNNMDANISRYYKLDPGTGEMQLLLESPDNIYYMTADEKYLYLAGSNGVRLFDLEKGELAARQDQVFSEFVAAKWSQAEDTPLLFCPWQDGVYLLTHQGLYWHKLYDETVELVIDGGGCSMSTAGKTFAGLAVRETEGEPEFYVLYNDKELVHYTYDATLPSVPDALRVYSVYEDSQVAKAVAEFRAQHPDIPVVYEVGMNALYGATEGDVLKNLATEIAAGKGPDILVMDDIPFEAYADKGVLADLSDLREGMTQETYFVNVIDGFARNGKQYAIPMTFAVPVLGGKQELVEGLESLSDLADLLERERAVSKSDYVFCTWDAESTLRLLAQSSQGAWIQDGNLDKEAVSDFLTQAKRINDIQFSVKEEPIQYNNYRAMVAHPFVYPNIWIGDYSQYPLARRFDSDGLYCMIDKAKWWMGEGDGSCYAGFMSGGESDYILIRLVQTVEEESYVRMPGQQYGTCLASSLLAMNAGTNREEESRMFLEYAVSAGFLSGNYLNGTPISRTACLAKQSAKRSKYEDFGGVTLDMNRPLEEYDIDMLPTEEDYRKLNQLLDGVTGVNFCDSVVYETVVEYGIAALEDELEIPEAVDAIEKKVKIYLAE